MKRFLTPVLLASSLLLGACATRDVPFQPAVQAVADQPFTAAGRLSVNVDGKGHVANFDWQHAPERDTLSVTTPVGSTVARLTRDAAGVTLEADGKRRTATDVEALTEETLGWRLPLSNLVWWIRGQTAPGLAVERLPDGSVRQEGWTIRFVSDAEAPGPYPRRGELSRDRLSMRLVVHAWQ